MVQLVLSPRKAWEDIAADKEMPERLVSGGMYPLFGVASASVFLQALYQTGSDLAVLVVMAVVVFASYFATYAFARVVFPRCVEKCAGGYADTDRCLTVIAYGLSLLAVATTICYATPMSLGLPYILPLAVTLIIWRSDNYLDVKEDYDTNFAIYSFLCLALPPLLLQALFDWALEAAF